MSVATGCGATATGIGETDSGYAFTFGELWFQVPTSLKLVLDGKQHAMRIPLQDANVLDTASQRGIPVLVVGPTPTLDEERNARLAELNAASIDDAAFLYVAHDVGPRAMSPKISGFVQPKSWFVDFSPVTLAP